MHRKTGGKLFLDREALCFVRGATLIQRMGYFGVIFDEFAVVIGLS